MVEIFVLLWGMQTDLFLRSQRKPRYAKEKSKGVHLVGDHG